MIPKPRADLKPNTADFERFPLVKPTGFREYDALWLFPEEINLMGLNAVGMGVATLFARRGVPKRMRVDNGPEFVSNALDRWAYPCGVILDFSCPGKPADNPFVESFDGGNVKCFVSGRRGH